MNPDASRPNKTVIGHPILVYIYLNGSIVSGTMNFNVKPGSQSIIVVKTTFPWSSFPSISQRACVLVSFVIYPFPANGGAIPSWLHVSPPVSIVDYEVRGKLFHEFDHHRR